MAKLDPDALLRLGEPKCYRATIRLDRVTAGRPKDPKTFETLVRMQAHKGTPGTAVYDAAEATIAARLQEPGGEVDVPEEIETVTREFSVVDGAPCIRGYQVMAMLKESLATLAGNSPGYFSALDAFKRGVFVTPDYIPMRDAAKNEVQYSAGHVMGPRGDRSILKAAQVIEGATAAFEILVQPGVPQSYFTPAVLEKLLRVAQASGIGSDRTLGSGRFEMTAFEEVVPAKR